MTLMAASCPVFTCRPCHAHTHTSETHTLTGTLRRHNVFYTVQTICVIALHLNLALTGDFVHFYFPQKLTLYDL